MGRLSLTTPDPCQPLLNASFACETGTLAPPPNPIWIGWSMGTGEPKAAPAVAAISSKGKKRVTRVLIPEPPWIRRVPRRVETGHRNVAKLPRRRKRGQQREVVRIEEIPGDARDAHNDRKEDPEQAPAGASPLLQLVEAPEKLRLFLRGERPTEHELLHDLGKAFLIASVASVPLGQRKVGAVRIDLDALFVLVHFSPEPGFRRRD